ncbi:hypothetical protein PENTCL1PPCAC_29720 [Pristionchus entomophagus]|uniref:Uncharacterized protein n=1 Tax=Pristionchus entomophagus TaxID=358040 RepID=A0AAV5UKI9_9BILA|nr:hypothetical protein PENTCL1PPCAC_29720 [Pristionchus entomophagus]
MQLLSLLALPLVAAAYGVQYSFQPSYGSYPQPVAAAAPAYGAPSYPVAAASPVFFPVFRGWGGRPTLDDEFQGPKIRAPISNPFFVPRFRGEHCLDRHDYGHRWGSNFGGHRHHHHHHHDGDFFGGRHRHHHHHFVHSHPPVFVGVPTFAQQPPAQAYPAQVPQPAYPQPAAAAPAGNYY